MLLGSLAIGSGPGEAVARSSAILASFILRNFYFTFFELRWGGATLGKRKLGLRVISRDGGALTVEAVFARNLTRDLEVFLPLTVLVAPGVLFPGIPVGAALAGAVWLGVFALLPLFSRDRLRVGDIVAGTLVVRMPRAQLLRDLAASRDGAVVGEWGAPPAAGTIAFTAEQLDHYGIKELQILEDLLRKSQGISQIDVLGAVAEKIKRRIRWSKDRWRVDDWEFLSAFYKAQRVRLEQKMLFGVRQEEKKKSGPPTA